MKFKWKSVLPYVFSLVILLVFTVYLYRNADHYRQLLDLSTGLLVLLVGLRLIFFCINGLINYLFYDGLGVTMSFNESLGLAAINTLANQLPFSGGLIAKGVYLKQRHQLAYTRFLSATLALYICFIAANGAIGVTVLALWTLTGGIKASTLLLLGFSAMMVSILVLWLPVDASSLPGKWGQQLARLMDGWQALSQNWLLTGKLIGLQILMTVLFAARFWIAFHALSQDVTMAQCILFSAATILTRLVNFAPGGLGVREAIVASIASILGFEFGVSAIAVGIDRLVATVVTAVLGTVYTYILTKGTAKVPFRAEPDEAQQGDSTHRQADEP